MAEEIKNKRIDDRGVFDILVNQSTDSIKFKESSEKYKKY